VKLAVSGKGGVGKTTLVAFLAKSFAEEGKRVIVIDADPDANLGRTLGFPEGTKIKPLIEMEDLIEERTGAKPGQRSFFKLNPRVDDLPDKFSISRNGIRLMVLGTISKGGGGCACPENTFLKSFLNFILLETDDVVILDMPAGIEHLGRGTAQGVDKLLIVVEPTRNSVETAYKIKKLAKDIGLNRFAIVANKIKNEKEKELLKKRFNESEISAFLPYDEKIRNEEDMDSLAIPKGIKELIKKVLPHN
jgi:CO dehydrogenase maturation factor